MKAGSLYYHFASKDEIVGEVLRIGVERVFADVRAAVMRLPADATCARRCIAHRGARRISRRCSSCTTTRRPIVRIFAHVPEAIRERSICVPATRTSEFWTRRCSRAAPGPAGSTPRRDLRLARLFLISALNGSLEWFDPARAPVETVATELTATMLSTGSILRPALARAAAPAKTRQ